MGGGGRVASDAVEAVEDEFSCPPASAGSRQTKRTFSRWRLRARLLAELRPPAAAAKKLGLEGVAVNEDGDVHPVDHDDVAIDELVQSPHRGEVPQ